MSLRDMIRGLLSRESEDSEDTDGEKGYVCLCGKWFSSQDELDNHLKDVHQ